MNNFIPFRCGSNLMQHINEGDAGDQSNLKSTRPSPPSALVSPRAHLLSIQPAAIPFQPENASLSIQSSTSLTNLRICSSNQQNIPPYPPPPFNMNNYCSFSSQEVCQYHIHPHFITYHAPSSLQHPPQYPPPQHHYVVGYNAHPSSYPPPPPPYSYGNPFNNPPYYPPQSPYPQPYGNRACLETRKSFSTEEVRTLRIPLLIIFCFQMCLIFLSTNKIIRQRI